VSPYQSSEDLTPHYYAPGTLGAIEVQLGAGFTFGKHAVAPPATPASPGAP
jgi:hypothetical protein